MMRRFANNSNNSLKASQMLMWRLNVKKLGSDESYLKFPLHFKLFTLFQRELTSYFSQNPFQVHLRSLINIWRTWVCLKLIIIVIFHDLINLRAVATKKSGWRTLWLYSFILFHYSALGRIFETLIMSNSTTNLRGTYLSAGFELDISNEIAPSSD